MHVSFVGGLQRGQHTVIMRVFDGGEGSTSGGRSEKSSESDDLFLDDDRECWGEASVVDMLGNMP